MQQDRTGNAEVEISLVELFAELWGRRAAVAACAALCAAVAALCAWVSAPGTTYTLDGRLRVPLSTGPWQINTCAQLLSADVESLKTLRSVSQAPNSHVLIARFSGEDAGAVKAEAAAWLPKAKARLDELLTGEQKIACRLKAEDSVRKQLAELRAAAAGDPGIEARIDELKDLIVAKMEEGAFFPEVELIAPEEPVETPPARHVARDAVFGALGAAVAACAYFTARFVYKKAAA